MRLTQLLYCLIGLQSVYKYDVFSKTKKIQNRVKLPGHLLDFRAKYEVINRSERFLNPTKKGQVNCFVKLIDQFFAIRKTNLVISLSPLFELKRSTKHIPL